MMAYQFDDRNIRWEKFGDFDFFVFSILGIDTEQSIADVLFKFEPHWPIVLHRHKALNKTFVVQGEHRLYKVDGSIKEIRSVGTYTSSPASEDPHRECGGDNGAIVFFSMRGRGVLYELLDDAQNLIGVLTFDDLITLWDQAHENEAAIS